MQYFTTMFAKIKNNKLKKYRLNRRVCFHYETLSEKKFMNNYDCTYCIIVPILFY